MMPLQPQRVNIPIGGGLTQDETPEYLDPPALYQCDNFYHATNTSLKKRNGYDMYFPVVDSRGTARDMSQPLTGESLDRFIKTGASVTFAARGYLWSYDPSIYAGATGFTPKPNTVRHGEIPDLQVIRDTVVTSDGGASRYIQDACAARDSSGLQCVSYLVKHSSTTDWHARIIDANGNVVSDTLLSSSTDTFLTPRVIATAGGFVATVLNFTAGTLSSQKFLLTAMQWSAFTWPTVNWGGYLRTEFNYYDIAGTNTDTFSFLHVIADCLFVVGMDVVHEPGVMIGYTINANTGAITHGPFLVGQTGWTGTAGPWPAVSIAATQSAFAVAWYDNSFGALFASFVGDTANSATTVDAGVAPVRVGIGSVSTGNGLDAAWNVVYQIEQVSLTYISATRYVVNSVVYDSDQVQVGALRSYYDSVIASSPFSVNGGSYVLLIPDLLYETPTQEYKRADIPWILTRTFNDQWRGDTGEEDANSQFPHAVWGYGTAFAQLQPFRIMPDPSWQSRRAFGAIVTQDVFAPGYGNQIVDLILDSTSDGRYESAPLPGGGSIFACGSPWIFDGARSFEAAFVARPVIVVTSQTTGGSLEEDANPDDYHYFQVIYEHTDERGRITSSPVSATSAIKITATGNKITLQIANQFWTARKPNTILVKVFMCRDNETFALAGTAVCATYAPGSAAADVSVTISSYPATTAPLIYTYDGTLESGYVETVAHLIRWNDRVWLADGANIRHSHGFLDGVQTSFPDTFSETLDRTITAILPLDDRMIAWGADSVMYRSGEGPNPNGQGSSYSTFAFITHQIGCTNARSVFYSMLGVYFQSRRGLELMSSAGQVVHQRGIEQYFVPSSTQGYGDAVMGAITLPRDHQSRFLVHSVSDDVLYQLVFDYSTNTWSRWSGSAVWGCDQFAYVGDIAVVKDTVYLLTYGGRIFVEANERYYDTTNPVGGSPTHLHINWTIKSPWIKAEGLQGFQRVWRSTVLGKCSTWTSPPYLGAPTPTLGIEVDESADYDAYTLVHTSKTINDLQTLRDAAGNFQLTIGHKYQRCSGYQLQLSSTDTNAWNYIPDVSGVTEILGLWSEFGIEPGTGRGRNEGKV